MSRWLAQPLLGHHQKSSYATAASYANGALKIGGGAKSTVFKSVGAMAPLASPVPTPL